MKPSLTVTALLAVLQLSAHAAASAVKRQPDGSWSPYFEPARIAMIAQQGG